ncbi:conserved hypothetical protein [Altererythrobacter sp. B11]|uniref:energy transducer TonB n=1 Tax=Altererythrobacter sp. B11 TaxID=2060312 RepID=UPI000DC6FAA5|nr:energy transducer TonB [Altererythrobacter sp. B11]BBC74318.1 conserved hypothetical protein [Altererythrobacter sp. B11]
MAASASLSREERIGLGIAAAAHVALVAVLVFYDKSPPHQIPVPERMEVSLASEVSLRSTAPDPAEAPQAAVAPELSAEPEPVAPPPPPAPERVERPAEQPVTPPAPRAAASSRPAPRPTAQPRPSQPQPKPSAAPRQTRPDPKPAPSPSRSSRPTGTRIGSDFLSGAGASDGSDRGSPAKEAGPAVTASIQAAMARQIKPHWSAPQGVDTEKLVTYLNWDLNPDGSLKGRPTCVRQTGETPSNSPQKALHCERAIRAIQLAAPFNLPEEYYNIWKSPRNVKFDRNL